MPVEINQDFISRRLVPQWKLPSYPKWDPHKLLEVTPEEVKKIQLRQKMRSVLKARYKMLSTNPHDTRPFQFDPAVQRWNSARVSSSEHFKVNPRTLGWAMALYFVPLALLTYLIDRDISQKDRKIRSGELMPKDRSNKLLC